MMVEAGAYVCDEDDGDPKETDVDDGTKTPVGHD